MGHAELNFDSHQWAGYRPNAGPVHAEFSSEGWTSTGISFDDYSRMHTQRRAAARGRRLETPFWAVNQPALAQLLTVFMERRCGLRKPGKGTLKERLARAQELLAANVPNLQQTLKKLCLEYVALKREDPNAPRVNKLAAEIENTDTQLRFSKDAAAMLLGCIYQYYRVGLNSVGVGAELSIKPPHVRQLLHRLNRTWLVMGHTPAPPMPPKPKPTVVRIAEPKTPSPQSRLKLAARAALRAVRDERRARVVELFHAGKSLEEIGKEVGYSRCGVWTLLRRVGVWPPGGRRLTPATSK